MMAGPSIQKFEKIIFKETTYDSIFLTRKLRTGRSGLYGGLKDCELFLFR